MQLLNKILFCNVHTVANHEQFTFENKIKKKGGNASLKSKIGDNFAQDKIECNVVKLNL